MIGRGSLGQVETSACWSTVSRDHRPDRSLVLVLWPGNSRHCHFGNGTLSRPSAFIGALRSLNFRGIAAY
jgi:hypothetical protein